MFVPFILLLCHSAQSGRAEMSPVPSESAKMNEGVEKQSESDGLLINSEPFAFFCINNQSVLTVYTGNFNIWMHILEVNQKYIRRKNKQHTKNKNSSCHSEKEQICTQVFAYIYFSAFFFVILDVGLMFLLFLFISPGKHPGGEDFAVGRGASPDLGIASRAGDK